jgi:hypothetical protein
MSRSHRAHEIGLPSDNPVVREACFLWHAQVFSLADGVDWEGSVDVNIAVGSMVDTAPAMHEYHLSPTGCSGGDHTACSCSDRYLSLISMPGFPRC